MKNKFLAVSTALSLAGVAFFGGTMSANADDTETITAPVELVIVETPAVVEENAPVANTVEEAVAPTTTFSLVDNTEEKLSICHSGSGNNWTYIAPDASGYNGHKNHDHDIYGLSEADCLAKNVITEPTDEDYVTVGWLAVAPPPNHFDETQTYLFSEETEDPSLSTLDDEIAAYLQTLECGTDADIQVDVYIKDDVTAALIAGGVLHGPNNPTEHLIPGGEGTAWKFVHLEAEDCVPVPNALYLSHVQECGSVDITLRNVSPWIYPTSVKIDGVHSYGPTVDNRTDGKLNGPQKDQSKTRTISFPEDSGVHTVEYRIDAGSEKDLYIGTSLNEWVVLTVLTDCTPPEIPEPKVEVSYSEFGGATPTCEDPEVTWTREKTTVTTPYKVIGEEGSYELVEDTDNVTTVTVTDEETQTVTYEGEPCGDLPTPDALAYTGDELPVFWIVGGILAVILGVVAYFVDRTVRRRRLQ